ncbi:amino acid adenylation domain-containing protein [Filimonas lacunae]|uniref:Amino acid adenylation domain-containing protein n=1 Tax=Filimonas lacunae TaxID=477680 RepID=A0A173MCP9_9BACT|nr:non-ribosomal peptide synthetase [Filimonas lacunae]BAV05297.1 malonyl CoA-acyl carrier protein transacylase [Filimonas lacunae]SIT22134.1 amino acid adenylation domain-containing protein [Filimonas lacunae]
MTGNVQFNPVAYDPLRGPEIEKVGFTNESQKEIYLSTLIGGADANRAYNECFALLLTGTLQVALLEEAIQQLFKRHEALRSSISANGEYVFVYAFSKVPIVHVDLSDMPAGKQQEVVKDIALQNAATTFDLLNGPLLLFHLVKLGEAKHQLIINIHHIIGDGWSVGVILQDLGKLYSAAVKGTATNLLPAPQMLPYAKTEMEAANGPQQQQIRNFWLQQFKAPLPELDMPTDFPRPAKRSYKSRRDDHGLPAALTHALKETGKKHGTSFITTLLVSFELFLYKVTGQTDIVLGLPAAGQSSTGNTGLVGHCVNLLPLRSSLNGDLTFAAYLQKRRSEILEAYEHQHITFGSLLKALNIPRDSSRVTLVPVVFNVDLGLDNDVQLEGLQHRLTSFPREYETFEVFVNISGNNDKITVEWSYNTQLFKPRTIQQFHETFERILQQIVENPAIPLKALSATDKAVGNEVSGRMNETGKSYPKEKALHELISAAAEQHLPKTAIRYAGKNITYQEVLTASNQLAHALIANGVKPGDRIGISLDRTPELVITLLAIMKAGAVFLPLDPSYPVSRTRYVLGDVAAQLMITSQKYAAQYDALKLLLTEELFADKELYAATAPVVPYAGNELIYILHTSGSTGQPKGVEVTHRNVVNLFTGMLKSPGITAADKLLAITSISFDIAYVELFLTLLAGAEIVLANADMAKDGRALLQVMEQENISMMQATPATWKMLIEAGWEKSLPIKIITGGEALSLHLARELLVRCEEVWNMYGPTETAIYATAKRVHQEDEIITIGKPVQNTQVFILDANMQPVPPGSIGEIYIGGEGVARGYINKSKLTAERFITNTLTSTNGKLYKTGDLGKLLPHAEIQCLGRSDQQIKIRGYRIEPEEVEYHLLGMPGVREAVVHAVQAGAEEVKLVAFVVVQGLTDADFDIKAAQWKEQLQALLPAYMVPQQVIRVTEIPLSPNGKTDKKQLGAIALQQLHQHHQRVMVLPETKEQKLLAEIWKDLLQLDKVSIHDDFFELGGHSLTAVSVMVRIEKETGVRLPIATLFEHETIAKLASLIEEKDVAVQWTSLVPIKSTGSKTPVYIIHGSGLNVLMFHSIIKNFAPDRPLYGIQALGLDGTDPEITSIEDVAARYIADMRQQNPDGPYIFLGYSLGGMIALEMSRQLEAIGKKVTMLGMIDTYVDNVALFDSRKMQLVKKVLRQFPKILFFAGSFFRYPQDTILYQLKSIKGRFQKLLMGGTEEKMITADQSFQEKIYEEYDRAYLEYRLAPYHKAIHLFKVKKKLYYLDDPMYMGWKPFAKGGLFIHDLPGDHKTFIEHPNEVKFVAVLEKAIETAESNG